MLLTQIFIQNTNSGFESNSIDRSLCIPFLCKRFSSVTEVPGMLVKSSSVPLNFGPEMFRSLPHSLPSSNGIDVFKIVFKSASFVIART